LMTDLASELGKELVLTVQQLRPTPGAEAGDDLCRPKGLELDEDRSPDRRVALTQIRSRPVDNQRSCKEDRAARQVHGAAMSSNLIERKKINGNGRIADPRPATEGGDGDWIRYSKEPRSRRWRGHDTRHAVLEQGLKNRTIPIQNLGQYHGP